MKCTRIVPGEATEESISVGGVIWRKLHLGRINRAADGNWGPIQKRRVQIQAET